MEINFHFHPKLSVTHIGYTPLSCSKAWNSHEVIIITQLNLCFEMAFSLPFLSSLLRLPVITSGLTSFVLCSALRGFSLLLKTTSDLICFGFISLDLINL